MGMLVLSRKKGESIMVGEQIELVVVSVEGDTVRLGINAPKHVEIHRKEVYLSIRNANQEAIAKRVDLGKLADLVRSRDN